MLFTTQKYFMNFISISHSEDAVFRLVCSSELCFVRAKKHTDIASFAVRKFCRTKKKEYHGKSERTREWKATQKKAATTHNYDYFADNNEHFTLIYLAIRSNSVHKRKKITMQKNWRQKGLLHHFHYACNSSRVFLRHKFLPLTYPFLRGTLSRQTPRNSLNI